MNDTRSRFQIRGETRLKNARLVRLREESGMTQRDFARSIGVSYTTYNGYETLRIYPANEKHRTLLAELCHCTEEDLFPEELKKYAAGEEARGFVKELEIEPSRLLGNARKQALLVESSSNPDKELDQVLLREELEIALSKLKSRQSYVLRLYFGLDGEDSLTLEEIGRLLGISLEATRQIKEKALSRLRDSRPMRILEPFFRENVSGVVSKEVQEAARKMRKAVLWD